MSHSLLTISELDAHGQADLVRTGEVGPRALVEAALKRIEGDATSWEAAPLESLAHDGQLTAYKHDGFWQPMDTLRDKNYLEQLWAERRAPWRVWDE